MRKNIFLHLRHVIAHSPSHVPKLRVQTNTPNYTFSSFCLHSALTGTKRLIYNTLRSVGNTPIHLHYHLHTRLYTLYLHCYSKAVKRHRGSGFRVVPIGRPLPLCRETRVAQPPPPFAYTTCTTTVAVQTSADKCIHQCTLKALLPTLPKTLIINAVQTLCVRCRQKGAKLLTRARASIYQLHYLFFTPLNDAYCTPQRRVHRLHPEIPPAGAAFTLL